MLDFAISNTDSPADITEPLRNNMESAPVSPEDPFLLQVREIVKKYYSVNPGPSNLASNTAANSMARASLNTERIPTRQELEETWRCISHRLESAAKAEEVLRLMDIQPCSAFADFDKSNTGMHDVAAHGSKERIGGCWTISCETNIILKPLTRCGRPWYKVRCWVATSMAVSGLTDEQLRERMRIAEACESRGNRRVTCIDTFTGQSGVSRETDE